ncbi:hypothetical protein ES705_15973 [subsurface metagenome]
MKKLKAMWTWLVNMVWLLIQEWKYNQIGGKPADTPFEITEVTPGFVLGSDVPVGTGDGVTESIFGTYTVPDGVYLVFLPTDELQFYGKDIEAAPAELTDYCPVLLYHKDSSSQGSLWRASCLYVNCKFSADVNSRKKMNNKWVAQPKELVQLRAIAESGKSLDVSACHLSISCRRIAPMLQP